MKPDTVIRNGIRWFDQSAAEVLRQFRDGVLQPRTRTGLCRATARGVGARKYQVSLLRRLHRHPGLHQRRIVRSGSGLEFPMPAPLPDVHEQFHSREG